MYNLSPKARFSSSVGNGLFNSASLDLQFAKRKSLVDATTGAQLVTFTRASSGTYVGSDGLIKTATTNLLTYSEDFNNAAWAKTNASATPNSVVAPNGTLTADTLVRSGTSLALVASADLTPGAVSLTCSIYAKAGTQDFLVIQVNINNTASASFITFNLTNGSAGTRQDLTGSVAFTTAATNVGDGWYRCSVTFVGGATNSAVRFGAASSANTRNGTDGGTIYIWGAQLEQSSSVGEYIPTTSTINSAPRFDHNPTTGESLGLLGEEQRTNLCLQSEDFSTTWGTTNYTVTTNATTAPNGTVTADKLIRNTTDTTTSVTQNVTVTANTAYNYSIFVKASEWSKVGLREGSVSGNYVTFDLSSGTIVSSSVAIGAITAFANGWYRISMQMTTGAAQTTYGIRLIPLPNSYTSGTPSYSFAGDGTSGVFAWGAQLEAGAFPTSYIPTTTAAATRSADVASISGSNFSSWYRQDEGTVFAAYQFPSGAAVNSSSRTLFDASSGTADNRINVRGIASGVTADQITVRSGASTVAQFSTNGTAVGAALRTIAAVYRLDDYAAVATGSASAVTDTSGALPVGINQASIGGAVNSAEYLSGHIRRLTYWPQRLSNNVLQSITQ